MRTSPSFIAPILDRRPLHTNQEMKGAFHIVLGLEGSNIHYQLGDSIGIFPENQDSEVEEILELVPGEKTLVVDREGEVDSWRGFLKKKANLKTLNRQLIEIVAEETPDLFLKELLSGERGALRDYLESFHVGDFLASYREVFFTPQKLASLLLPLMPRFYSAASSQRVVGNEVHLLVGDIHYEMRGKERFGVCSHQLCHTSPLGVPHIPLFVQPAHRFSLTEEDSAPMIMIGPGTGVAPFRAFMQERVRRNSSRKNWLFFGEWHEESHFYYKEDWLNWVNQGWLELTTAFSRDQQHKVYVQHRMLEQREKLYAWIKEGSYLYICGDASQMARGVEDALLEIFQSEGNLSLEDAKSFWKELWRQKRIQKDVY